MPSRLKSLELHGYKTFANRTIFAFSDKLTVIVGPNGSGKSNIADSIRWVLGEQSYSLLRGKKTEDMIFSGSEARPRAGMASATITFDNSEGWLPIDFSEVAITRRAYRDGENDYLINNQKIRLKDVTELLASSGLAERTYTVIGQGLVDAALALKAEERRRLFEEAAGIGLHRARREEALRRLDVTQRNLERVQDILAELQPRLQSLERQARRAQEYEHIRADLKVMMRDWYGYHWHRDQKELAEAQNAARSQETRVTRAREEQIQLEGQLQELREQMQGRRNDLNNWHRQLSELHAKRETTSREMAVMEERQRSLLEGLKSSEHELLDLAEETSLFQEQLRISETETQRLASELEDGEKQLSRAVARHQAVLAERKEKERVVQEVREALEKAMAARSQSQAHLAERRAFIQRSQQALLEGRQSSEGAVAQERSAAKRLAGAAAQEKRLLADLGEVEKELQAHLASGKSLQEELMGVQERKSRLLTERSRLTAQMEVFEQAEASFAGYAEGTRMLLEAAKKAKLVGMKGALNRFLEVPAEFETAIAAALGEFLDAVLLDADVEPALTYLDGENGRGALIPVQRLRPAKKLSLKGEKVEGVLGVAADLVHAPAELRGAVEALLGQVWIVEDRRAADLLIAGQVAGVRAVTLRGEVFHANGTILAGGGVERAEKTTILGRARQKKESSQEQSRLDAALSELDHQIGLLSARLEEYRQETALLEKRLVATRSAAEEASQERLQAELAREQASRLVEWRGGQMTQLQAEILLANESGKKLAVELEEMDRTIAGLKERLHLVSAAMESSLLEETQEEVTQLSTLQAVLRKSLEGETTRKQERLAALGRVVARRHALDNRIKELKDTLSALAAERKELASADERIHQEIKVLQSSSDPAELELVNLESRQLELQKVEASLRQSLNILEQTFTQARINLARRQEEMQALKRRIEDDFGLVAFEFENEVAGQSPLPLDGMVEQLPKVRALSQETEDTIKRLRAQLRRIGAVNLEALAEYQEVNARFEFLKEQVSDLTKAEADIRQVIKELDELMEREFQKTFEAVADEFKEIFTRLFGGGSARLLLTDPEDLTNSGIDIEARLPGRRTQGLSLLSGGERSLTAVALVSALLKVSPTPFCVLDEVDAMLDEVNVGRFLELLSELGQNTQFVVITHNRSTVQVADIIYGVTMGRDSSSQVLSLKLEEVGELME